MKERTSVERVHKGRRENKAPKTQLPEEAAEAVAYTGEAQNKERERNQIKE